MFRPYLSWLLESWGIRKPPGVTRKQQWGVIALVVAIRSILGF